ncbi:putative potassium transport system protein kup 1 [Candidatus Competibacter denitrificans Run_A_D11]|uniref:Probable potassium transport system protein Kup n=1 Tax=Candidatus Competibacter denitrificans Run_A_D11 TaxID=1400863 RepID=W6M7P8_9GAMM|nr:potassium transporter Kup [Candidatus Competibacter denitrificans]CDI02619.1 putative potassium transport system protein kup 1 [Candidatus Competibacter denitrificans Run_A_D11]
MNAPADPLPADDSVPHDSRLLPIALAALGVVFGDIGTSPLYAMRECFGSHYGLAPTHDNVLGILSLIFWALIVVISVKYVTFVMRADNRGEGGILALLALATHHFKGSAQQRAWLVGLGIFGAGLFYGDGVITPAISVLSAVEGLHIATPLLDRYVVPITLIILVGLFLIQARGTARVGAYFGPVMVLWFLTVALLGLASMVQAPEVLSAFNPGYALTFFTINRWTGFLVMGSVFLAVTGGEALYADMGHFGKRPIRLAWFSFVLPAIVLNYLGQGALLLRDPTAISHPFYLLAPSWLLYPVVILATLATVIASQAVISGVFSVTRQAVQLGYCPRIAIRHTSDQAIGQIYVPAANWALLIAVIVLVLGFHTSSNLAAAYGIAVTIAMVIDTLLVLTLARIAWGWSWLRIGLAVAAFLMLEMAFLSANALKIPHGGWITLLIAGAIFTLMITWKDGRKLLNQRLQENAMPLDLFLQSLNAGSTLRVPGTAVFLTSTPDGVPNALLHNMKHNKVIHERLMLLTVKSEEIPRLTDEERVSVHPLGNNAWRIVVRYGFTENPDLPHALALCERYGLHFEMMDTTFFLGRATLIPTKRAGMALWREKLFASLFRNATRPMDFFRIPYGRVVEMGTQVEL